MSSHILTPNKATLAILVSLLAISLWLFARSYQLQTSFEIPNLITETKSCLTNSVNNQDTFVTFITDQDMADSLLHILCQNPVIERQFGKVDVQWSHNEQEIIQYVGKGIADLALVKENVMQAFATQRTHGYEIVAHYQDYATYLISLREKPVISKQYLWGKRLGLLDYPSSRSGHMVPKQMLKDLGMSLDNLEIVYANSHSALRELLAAGEVDLISSYWQASDLDRFSPNYITPIQSNISGSKWYLKMETQNTDLLCGVQASLTEFASASTVDYFNKLILEPACNSQVHTIWGGRDAG